MISITALVLFVTIIEISHGLPVPHGNRNITGFPQIRPTKQNRSLSSDQSSCSITYAFTEPDVTTVVIRSPDYPNNYPAGSQCNYEFTSPPGTTLDLSCIDWVVPCDNDKFYVSRSGDSTFQLNEETGEFCGEGTMYGVTIGNKLAFSLQSTVSTTSTRRYECEIYLSNATAGPPLYLSDPTAGPPEPTGPTAGPPESTGPTAGPPEPTGPTAGPPATAGC